MKGLLVDVFRTSSYGDCTNGGLTSVQSRALLVGEGVAQVFNSTPGEPVLTVVRRRIGMVDYVHAEPIVPPDGTGWMAGGNFVYSSDSRFSQEICQYPISVHDRQEF